MEPFGQYCAPLKGLYFPLEYIPLQRHRRRRRRPLWKSWCPLLGPFA